MFGLSGCQPGCRLKWCKPRTLSAVGRQFKYLTSVLMKGLRWLWKPTNKVTRISQIPWKCLVGRHCCSCFPSLSIWCTGCYLNDHSFLRRKDILPIFSPVCFFFFLAKCLDFNVKSANSDNDVLIRKCILIKQKWGAGFHGWDFLGIRGLVSSDIISRTGPWG